MFYLFYEGLNLDFGLTVWTSLWSSVTLSDILAPTGAQEVLMFIRSFVRAVQVCLEQSIFIILAQIFKQSVRNKSALSEHSESDQRALREHSRVSK